MITSLTVNNSHRFITNIHNDYRLMSQALMTLESPSNYHVLIKYNWQDLIDDKSVCTMCLL